MICLKCDNQTRDQMTGDTCNSHQLTRDAHGSFQKTSNTHDILQVTWDAHCGLQVTWEAGKYSRMPRMLRVQNAGLVHPGANSMH